MKKGSCSCIYGVIGGVCLYIIEMFFSLLPYFRNVNFLFEFTFIASLLLGVITAIIVLLYKKPVVYQMVLRFVMLILSYIFVFVLNGFLGTRRIICELFFTQSSVSNDNVSGILTLIFLLVVAIVSVITLVATTILGIYNRKSNS